MIKAALAMFHVNWYAVPVLAVGVLMFLIGLFIFLQNRRSRVNFSFFLIGVCGLFWFLGVAGTYAASTPEIALAVYRTVTFLGVALIAPCTHYFSATWLGLFKQQKVAIRTGFFFGAAFYIVGLFSPRSFPGVYHYFWGFYPVYGPLNWYFLGFFFLVLLCAFYNFFSAFFKEPPGVRRTQIALITTGFLVSFMGSLDYLPKLLYPLSRSVGELTLYRMIYALGIVAVTGVLSTVMIDYPAERSRGKLIAITGFLNGLGIVVLNRFFGGLPMLLVTKGFSGSDAGLYTHLAIAEKWRNVSRTIRLIYWLLLVVTALYSLRRNFRSG